MYSIKDYDESFCLADDSMHSLFSKVNKIIIDINMK